MMVCTSCKTSYNVLRHSYVVNKGLDWSKIVLYGGSGGLVVDILGGVMQKRESPYFHILDFQRLIHQHLTLSVSVNTAALID